VCEIGVHPDGIQFSRDAIKVGRIKEDADYEGVRVQFHATLAGVRIPMQLDIGFGDVITPDPTEVEYPTLLGFPAPVLRAYPRETVVAEKLEALTALGLLNSRMKDFYDLALLSRMYPFEGRSLSAAVSATFHHRGTLSNPNRLGSRKHTPMTRREWFNGARSSVGAGLVTRRVIWPSSSRKSGRLLCLCFRPWRLENSS